jgi:4-amino-4-deoxy-L-arabinose transferase-like glycosyltransferase
MIGKWRVSVSTRSAVVLVGLTLAGMAYALAGDGLRPPGLGWAIASWLLGVALVIAGHWRAPGGAPESRGAACCTAWTRTEVAFVLLLALAAFALRAVALSSIPWLLTGDEAHIGLDGLKFAEGTQTNPFITGWWWHPALYAALQSVPLRLFGRTTFALRIGSAFVGALTVAGLYVFARRFWGGAVALVASGLLAGMAFHIHWSRLGLDPIYDLLLALIVLGAALEGCLTRERRWFLLAGAACGIALYFWHARLLALDLAALALYELLMRRGRLRDVIQDWLALGSVALAVALPLVMYYDAHPDAFTLRVQSSSIFSSPDAAPDPFAPAFLLNQFARSALAFHYFPDQSPFYQPGVPLLPPVAGLLFAAGLAAALWRRSRITEFALLVLLATVLLGGMFLLWPPQSQRYVIGLAAVPVFAGLALAGACDWLRLRLGFSDRAGLAAVGIITLWIALHDSLWYFNSYAPWALAEPKSEATHAIEQRLDVLERGAYTLYLVDAPYLRSVDMPSIPFFAPHVALYELAEPIEAPPTTLVSDRPAMFVFLPERLGEAPYIQTRCPGGPLELVRDHNGRPLLYWYPAPDGCN